ncbi:MAG: ATP-binding cassette domain-containing protein [bacterium]|nr:ATP-binding cassette domain-containing protein [bacterium]
MKLEFSQATVQYPPLKASDELLCALDRLSFGVSDGEAVTIIGPSGCGKSSALRLASGLLAPSSGTVLVDGKQVNRPRQSTALVLQDFGLLPWKSVYVNAELGLAIHRVERTERKRRTMSALEKVGLADFANYYPAELSGGMQQRLALARAIALDVDLLLLDEPLSALDALLREELQNLLLELWLERRHAQVLVTHSIEEAVFLGQRIIVMAPRPGRVVYEMSNPDMGSLEYRSSELYFKRCLELRKALASAGGEAQ